MFKFFVLSFLTVFMGCASSEVKETNGQTNYISYKPDTVKVFSPAEGNKFSIYSGKSCQDLADKNYETNFVAQLKAKLNSYGFSEVKDDNDSAFSFSYDCWESYKDLAQSQRTAKIENNINGQDKWTTTTLVDDKEINITQVLNGEINAQIKAPRTTKIFAFRFTGHQFRNNLRPQVVVNSTIQFANDKKFFESSANNSIADLLEELEPLKGQIKKDMVFKPICTPRFGFDWVQADKQTSFIGAVVAKSPATKAGLQVGDEILTMNALYPPDFYANDGDEILIKETAIPVQYRRYGKIFSTTLKSVRICSKIN